MEWFADICTDMPCSQQAQTSLPDFPRELWSPTCNHQLDMGKRPKSITAVTRRPEPTSLSYCIFLKGFGNPFLMVRELLQKLSFRLGPLTHHSLPHVLGILLPFWRHRLTFHIPASRGTGRIGRCPCKATLCHLWKTAEIRRGPKQLETGKICPHLQRRSKGKSRSYTPVSLTGKIEASPAG